MELRTLSEEVTHKLRDHNVLSSEEWNTFYQKTLQTLLSEEIPKNVYILYIYCIYIVYIVYIKSICKLSIAWRDNKRSVPKFGILECIWGEICYTRAHKGGRRGIYKEIPRRDREGLHDSVSGERRNRGGSGVYGCPFGERIIK